GTKASEKYFNVFGRLNSLAKPISWATGISNMLEWLVWNTSNVLGITKTEYLKRLIAWSVEDAVQNGTLEEKMNYVSARLAQELKRNRAVRAACSSNFRDRHGQGSSSSRKVFLRGLSQ